MYRATMPLFSIHCVSLVCIVAIALHSLHDYMYYSIATFSSTSLAFQSSRVSLAVSVKTESPGFAEQPTASTHLKQIRALKNTRNYNFIVGVNFLVSSS